MSDAQIGVLAGVCVCAVVVVAYAFIRGRRLRIGHYEKTITFIAARQSTIRPADIPLRDAAYLVRQHLAGQPTSRRHAHLPERSWQRAMHLCRDAGLVDAAGTWHVVDYPTAFSALQRVCKVRTAHQRQGNYVSAWD